ncbi:MAG: DUF1054 family protein [Armatimonadetes bacterium]|nr:DUF1054 family protein [Armatimonadota bacterium]
MAVFDVEDFQERMNLIRSTITPRLAMLADDLQPYLRDKPFDLYPHVARHLRRRTNPPDETWVAFSRDRRAYKKYAHLLAGISGRGPFARLVIKTDGIDFANLQAHSRDTEMIQRTVSNMQDKTAEFGFELERFDGASWVPVKMADISAAWAAGTNDFALGAHFTTADAAEGSLFVRKVADMFDVLTPFYEIGAQMS